MSEKQYTPDVTYFLTDTTTLIVGDGVENTWWITNSSIEPYRITEVENHSPTDRGYLPVNQFKWHLNKFGAFVTDPQLPVGYRLFVRFTYG